MNGRFSSSEAFQRLKERAEQLLNVKGSERPDIDKEDLLRLAYELEIYQVELELQNEELRRAKAELETSRNEFFDLYEAAPVAYVTLNEEGVVERANQAAHRMLKGAGEFFVGSSFSRWVYKKDLSVYFSFMEKPVSVEAAGPVELRLLSKNGETVHVQMETTVKIDEKEGLRHWRLTLVDITKRRRMEEDLRRSRDELQLSNKELQDFTFVASHDLQEPLRKVRTFGDMLAARSAVSLDETSRDYLKRMQTAAARMQTLLNSLLAYSRVTTRAESLKETDLRKSVEIALSDLEIMIKEENARMEIGDLPTVRADRDQMVHLFQNLIGNALKFHREGTMPHVKVYARVGEDSRAYEICVEDNGIGFEEMYLDKLFLPFQRLHGRSSDYEGVGMGLAICKKIVERHGGTITARSAPGKGAMFIVTLPRNGGQVSTFNKPASS